MLELARWTTCDMCDVQEASKVGEVSVSLPVQYLRAGRYVVRVTATAMDGALATRDLAVLVRKKGDIAMQSRCCRNSASIVAGESLTLAIAGL
jgi:hypothetical protein